MKALIAKIRELALVMRFRFAIRHSDERLVKLFEAWIRRESRK